MMAAVFMMQPLGQLMASVVGLAVIMTVGRNLPHPATSPEDYTAGTKTVDQIWRIVIGVGAFPALVAIAFRLTIPESPRYTLDVDHDGARALRDTQKYYNIRASIHESIANGYTDDVEGDAGLQQMPRAATDDGEVVNDNDDDSMEIVDIGEAANSQHEDEAGEKQAMPDPFSYSELRRFFWEEGNIKYLVGTSLAWFLLDFAFLGLGINNPKVIAELWAYTTPAQQVDAAKPLSWVNPSAPNQTIYEVLRLDAIQSIITISVGSLLGSAILIKVINYIPRKSWLAWSFVGLAVLFAIVGGTYSTAKDSNLHALTITLYVLSQLLFNLGPNGLTFILPAEIFPTRYRGTCHGISAAAGKLSSVIVQSFLPYTGIANPNQNTLGWILLGFSAAMALGAVVTWSWIPDVQNGRGTNADLDVGRRGRRGRGRGRFREYEVPSKRLEELALGRAGVLNEKRQVGFRKRAACLVGHKEEEN
jgi:PHS family inorganic phosphate transporter-like MFS transporter